MLKKILFSLLVILTSSNLLSATVAISFSPVLNRSSGLIITTPVDLRNRVISILVSDYDCIVFSRSNGLALLEEQRYAVSALEDFTRFPYPLAADVIVIPSIQREGNKFAVNLNYTHITGQSKSDVRTRKLVFSDKHEFLDSAAHKIAGVLVEELDLKVRPKSSSSSARHGEGDVWAVLPFSVILDPQNTSGDEPDVLRAVVEQTLIDSIPGARSLEPYETEQVTRELFLGATERKASEIGQQLGTDFLITGTVLQHEDIYSLNLQVVRCVDAMILASSHLKASSWQEVLRLAEEVTVAILRNHSNPPVAEKSSAEAAIEESQILYGIANRLAFSGGRNEAWFKYQSARTFQSAAFIGQDTYAGERAVRRMHVSIIDDPNIYKYYDDWQTRKLPEWHQEHNNWVIAQVRRMIDPSTNPGDKRILLKVLGDTGHWDETYELMMEIIRESGDNMDRYDGDARRRLQYTSLASRFDEADAFLDGLSPEVKGQSTRFHALMHFRRSGNEDREFAEMIDRLEQEKWSTMNGLPRLCHLIGKRLSPEERIETIHLLPKKLKSTMFDVLLLRSHQELGNESEVREIATLLLVNKRVGKGDLASEEELKKELREIVGEPAPWPTARSIQNIPDGRRMYLQPVGEYPREVLNQAVRIAGEFFKCEFVVRESIPPPTARSVFYNDMVGYIGVPLLRRFATARPPPCDAIYQAYLVDQYFLVYARGPACSSLYRKGLGYLISYRRYQQHIDSDAERAEALANELIRGFRYFIERSQGISYEESPDSSSCINSQSNVRRIEETKRGYCPECARNYASAVMDEVFTFHQALPAKDAFSEEYLGWRHPIDEHERESIRAYAESVQFEREKEN